jgi:hypothetical protein
MLRPASMLIADHRGVGRDTELCRLRPAGAMVDAVEANLGRKPEQASAD